MNTADITVLLFGGAAAPAPLAGLPAVPVDDASALDVPLNGVRRLVVVGADADLAAVLTRLLRAERLDIEVGYACTARAARRARHGTARRVPLIRDETGVVLVGAATWRGQAGPLHGEAVVDDTVLFDGEVPGVRIEPTPGMPGVRAAVLSERPRLRRRWVAGRAAQLGATAALLVRDGVAAPRPVRRSTFYRHTEGWLQVR